MTESLLVLIPAIRQHRPVVQLSIEHLRRQLPQAQIMILCPTPADYSDLGGSHVRVVADDALAPIGKSQLSAMLPEGGQHLGGWYYQQLLKYAAVAAAQTSRVLVIDADTVVLREIFCPPGTFFTSKEKHSAYFDHYRALFGFEPTLGASAIVNFMWFEVSALKDMLSTIESVHHRVWWQAIMAIVAAANPAAPFSEYETYANWYARTLGRHTEIPIDMFRRGDLLLRSPADYQRVVQNVAAKKYDALAFELDHRAGFIRRLMMRVVLHLGLRPW